MIRFEKKAVVEPVPQEADKSRFDQIREAAVDGHKKSATDAARRRLPPATDDDRLI